MCEARHTELIVKGFSAGSADAEPHLNQIYEKYTPFQNLVSCLSDYFQLPFKTAS